MTKIIAAIAIALGVPVTATAHADPPQSPDQCRTTGAMTVCRHADGTATVCGALIGCQPAYNVPPGFFDGR